MSNHKFKYQLSLSDVRFQTLLPHTNKSWSVNLNNMGSLWNSIIKYCIILTCNGHRISYCRKPVEILRGILEEMRNGKRKQNGLKGGLELWAEI